MNRKEIYEFIVKYKTENDGLSPSMREIMGQGVSSTSVVDWHLKKLEQDGKISCNGVRGIKVIGGEWRPPMKKYIDRGLMIIFAVLIVGALLVSVSMLSSTLKTEVNTYELNGVYYTCKHTPNEMECWLADDPNVGGGQVMP